MTTHRNFCLERAAAAHAAAMDTKLDNVREQCLRAAAAWEVMADRAERTERMRAESEAKKVAALAMAD